ncbi:unnamed protein product, partial [Amoebophrya sp. A120]|eukprot:GSA120T00020315001.1
MTRSLSSPPTSRSRPRKMDDTEHEVAHQPQLTAVLVHSHQAIRIRSRSTPPSMPSSELNTRDTEMVNLQDSDIPPDTSTQKERPITRATAIASMRSESAPPTAFFKQKAMPASTSTTSPQEITIQKRDSGTLPSNQVAVKAAFHPSNGRGWSILSTEDFPQLVTGRSRAASSHYCAPDFSRLIPDLARSTSRKLASSSSSNSSGAITSKSRRTSSNSPLRVAWGSIRLQLSSGAAASTSSNFSRSSSKQTTSTSNSDPTTVSEKEKLITGGSSNPHVSSFPAAAALFADTSPDDDTIEEEEATNTRKISSPKKKRRTKKKQIRSRSLISNWRWLEGL